MSNGCPRSDSLERELRELLTRYKFLGNITPVVSGSTLYASVGKQNNIGRNAMKDLMKEMDTYVPDPDRGKPFVIPIEDALYVQGKGTIATGYVGQGVINISDDVEVLGMMQDGPLKTKVNRIIYCEKQVNNEKEVLTCEGEAVSIFHSDLKRGDIYWGQFISQPGVMHIARIFQCELFVKVGIKVEMGDSSKFYTRTVDTQTAERKYLTKLRVGDNLTVVFELFVHVPLLPTQSFPLIEGDKIVGVGVLSEVFTTGG
jgi:elongation factor Tu